MITKYLITASIFSLTLVSTVQAADVILPEQPMPVVSTPAFSWMGLYLGGKIGGFSSKTSASYLADEKTERWSPVKKEFLPKLSGFIGGVYAGSNIDIDNGFIVGIETDIMWSNKKDTKIISSSEFKSSIVPAGSVDGISRSSELREEALAEAVKSVNYTLKRKWFGATRVRVGFSFDRFMPYVAGGIAYTQLRNILEKGKETSIARKASEEAVDFSDWLHDEKKTMVGYTFGGGVDFAMSDNIILRAEYRYSDFGKKKFLYDKVEMNYKTNEFQVGVAYKF
ncbi:outer membrane protein [Bartonella rattaustraliani]|uniref:outer membrane protein n=1 Tax=Bartonella rattaustraliani TaxID=481139 RepID=UPI0003033CFF|nr:outer membrane protein [Bartonella rattaustraliani]